MQAACTKRVGLERPTYDKGRIARCAVRSFVVLLLLFASSNLVAADRYLAVFESGERVSGAVDGWARPGEAPTIGGRALFDEQDPLRWLIDTRPVPGTPVSAMIEFFSGDRLPAVVVGYSPGAASPYRPAIPAHLIVRPTVLLKDSRNEEVRQLRIVPQMVRRWWTGRHPAALLAGESQTSEPVVSPPPLEFSTAETVDGRRLSIRHARLTADGLTLLSEHGLERIPYEQFAEFQPPAADPWPLYFDDVALLAPDLSSRLVQLETASGTLATTSVERYRPLPFNDRRNSDQWHHLIHPAWSLDAFAVPHGEVRSRCYFTPDHVPLSHLATREEKNDSKVHSAWRAQINRDAYGGALQLGDGAFGWGLGVHGDSELVFPLPKLAASFSTRVGIDGSVADGGWAQASVGVRSGDRQSRLWSSEELRGARSPDQCEALDVRSIAASDASAQLVLSVDSLPQAGAEVRDPLDIRDAVDWLEPTLTLDRELLAAEVERRHWQSIPAIEGWTLVTPNGAAPEDAAPQRFGYWDAELGRGADYRHALRVRGGVVLERRIEVPSLEAQLVVFAGRLPDSAKARLNIEANGSPVANREIKLRYSNDHEPPPIVARLGPWSGQTIDVRLIVSADGAKAAKDSELIVDWRSIQLRSGPLPPPRDFVESAPAPNLPQDRRKEVLNHWLELRVMLSEQLDEDACRAIAELPIDLLLAPMPHPDDEERTTSLAELLPGLIADHSGLKARMREHYSDVSELRLDRAISAADPFRVRLAAAQFPGTAASARAHAWMGDRALSRGDFAAAAELYRRALPDVPASLRRQVASRLKLAEQR